MNRLLVCFFCISLSLPIFANEFIKFPNVAGQFYSNDPKILSNNIDALIKQAPNITFDQKTRIIISPHAGYVYSGSTAAHGFKAAANNKYKTIVVIGPTHYYQFDGISIWSKGAMQTPLGNLKVDENLANQFLKESQIFSVNKDVFSKEHSVEVQLPFIQKIFPKAKIVPMIFGNPNPDVVVQLAVSLKKLLSNRDDVLLVVSADFSHFHNDTKAMNLDARAIESIMGFDYKRIWDDNISRTMEIDAFGAVASAVIFAQGQGYQPKFLEYKHSGDVSGDNSRVVGYASLIFTDKSNTFAKALNDMQKKKLLEIARSTIESYVSEGEVLDFFPREDNRLFAIEGTFVTINKNHNLRGCIGSVLGKGPLYKTVRDMAIAAAAHDPRFDAVTSEELKDISVEVSVLSEPWKIKSIDEIELGKHGVILRHGNKSGLFLPQVATSTGWSKQEFLSQLASQKTGLPRDGWKDPKAELLIFTADVFEEDH